MIDADRAASLLASLPPTSFLRQYCFWASYCTDAPLAYHVACGLSLLGTLAQPTGSLYMGQPVYAPQWVLLVGDSGSSRKSSAMNCATRLLNAAAPERLGPTPGSAQALYQYMADTSEQICVSYSEFGSFLADSRNGGVLAPLREAYTGLWDCQKTFYRTVKATRDIHNPRLSLLAGTTPTYLEAHTTHVDWEGGFLSRWMVIHARREFAFVIAPGVPHLEQVLQARVSDYNNRNMQQAAGLETDAMELYSRWYLSTVDQAQNDASPWMSGLANRAPTVALKSALGHAFDVHTALTEQPGWRIPLDSIEFGIQMATWHLECSESVVSSLATSQENRDERSILRALRKHGELTETEIFQRIFPPISHRAFKVAMHSLNERVNVWMLTNGRYTATRPISSEPVNVALDPSVYGVLSPTPMAPNTFH